MVLSSVSPRPWLLTVVVAANLLFAAVLSASLWNSRQQDAELQLRTGQNLALAIERNVSGTLDKIELALQEVSDSLETQLATGTIDQKAIEGEILRLGSRLPEIETLDYSDASGAVPANSGYPAGNKAISLADREYFQYLKNTPTSSMVNSKPVLGKTSNKWVIVFARRINQRDGRFAGVVYSSISLNHFTDTFRQLQLGQQGVVSIIDPTHAIIARYPAPPDPKVLGQKLPQEDLIALLKSDQLTFTRIIRSHVEGIERSYSFHRLASRPYHVTVGLSTNDAFAAWWKQVALSLAIFLAFFGITIFGAWQLMRSWQRQSEAHWQVTREKDRYRELNEQLESRVDERTRDLLTANKELKQALDHLGNSEKMAALGNLVAGVAHELNTPIGNLRLGASTYKDRIQEFSAELARGNIRRSTLTDFLADADELVRLLDRNAERAGEMISSFKAVAVDQSSNRRRHFDVQLAVGDVLSTLRQKMKRGRCHVTNAIPAGVMVDSYPGALMQIVSNLLENAMLHAFEGMDSGTVVIDLPKISDTEICLRFTDNGRGIAAEDAERIFEPFYSTKIGQGGSGLGLHLVREMVSNPLGGSITLDKENPVGATFIVCLPRTAMDPTLDRQNPPS